MRISDWSSDVCSSDLFLFFEFLEVAMDCGLRAGVAQRHPQGVDRRVLPLSEQCRPGLLDIGFIQTAACHGASARFRNVLHTMYLHTAQWLLDRKSAV